MQNLDELSLEEYLNKLGFDEETTEMIMSYSVNDIDKEVLHEKIKYLISLGLDPRRIRIVIEEDMTFVTEEIAIIVKNHTLHIDKLFESKEVKPEKIEFRSNGSYFIPYYKLGFKDNDCIDKVYIGACPDYDTVYESVEYMLRKNGIGLKRINDENLIQKSKLAYRNW